MADRMVCSEQMVAGIHSKDFNFMERVCVVSSTNTGYRHPDTCLSLCKNGNGKSGKEFENGIGYLNGDLGRLSDTRLNQTSANHT
jgi:hypothetical protein